MKLLCAVLLFSAPLLGQPTPSPTPDPFAPLAFLHGTWTAEAQGNAGVSASGTYTFQMELGNHVLARQSTYTGCKGPEDFNCAHGDLLYIYPEGPDHALKAIYFDNEGHVIHYSVSVPEPSTAILLSDPATPGPQFRLIYQLHDATMSGKFQIRMPGQQNWTSYLEWTGGKR